MPRILMTCALGMVMLWAASSTAAPIRTVIPSALAVDALIGEAGNQPYATQVLVARALRNRGSLQGVYGVNNPVVRKASARLRARCLRAWNESAVANKVGRDSGAPIRFPYRYFGCEADKNYFLAIGFKPVCKSGAITFYQ